MSLSEQCPRTEALSALVDDELDERERAALDAHVAGCVICAPLLTELRQLRAGFNALPDAAAGVDFALLVDRRLDAAAPLKPKPRPRPRRLGWRQLAPAALGGALSLSLGAYLGSALMLGAQATTQTAALQMAAFAATPPGALCPGMQACNSTGR